MIFIYTETPERKLLTAQDNSVEQIDSKVHGEAVFQAKYDEIANNPEHEIQPYVPEEP